MHALGQGMGLMWSRLREKGEQSGHGLSVQVPQAFLRFLVHAQPEVVSVRAPRDGRQRNAPPVGCSRASSILLFKLLYVPVCMIAAVQPFALKSRWCGPMHLAIHPGPQLT